MSINFKNNMETKDIIDELNKKIFFNSPDDEYEVDGKIFLSNNDNNNNKSVITKNFIKNPLFPYNNIIMIDINDILKKEKMSFYDFIGTDCYSGPLTTEDSNYMIDHYGIFLVSGGSSGGPTLDYNLKIFDDMIHRSGGAKYYPLIFTQNKNLTPINNIYIRGITIGDGGVYDYENKLVGLGGSTEFWIDENFKEHTKSEYYIVNTDLSSCIVYNTIWNSNNIIEDLSDYTNIDDEHTWKIRGSEPTTRMTSIQPLSQYYIPHSGEHVCGIGPQDIYKWKTPSSKNASYCGLSYFLCNKNEGFEPLSSNISFSKIDDKDIFNNYFKAKAPSSYGSSGSAMGKGGPTNGAPGLICIYF